MPKRAAPATPAKPRKRGRQAKNKGDGEDAEHDEEIAHQMRRRQIIDAKDDEEEWIRELEQEEGGRFLDDIYIPPKITRTEHPFTGERLVIEKITCVNFKSYAGIKEMGPFHKSFSAIIGPNGNGKSNIIDAMLFVFGYRAAKIRCKKVSTLIHTSEMLQNIKSCAVTVHFVRIIDDGDKEKEGTDDYVIVPGTRITVSRKAYANNSSVYSLNNSTVKFQEIAKFLKSNGVDLTHNRFLILQGEVEQIAQMPAIGSNGNDGLLEFLEDVIGTRRYIRPLAQLEERVEKLDYARDEKLQRVDKAEKEKAALTEPIKKAKEYLRDQNKKMKYQNILCQKQIYSAKLKGIEKEKIKVELEAKIATVQTRLDEIGSINQVRREEIKTAEKEFKSSEKEYAKVKKKFDAADAEFIQLNQELQRTNESRKKLQKEMTKLEEEIEKLKSVPDNHKRDIEQLTKRKLDLDTDIEKETASVAGDLEKLNLKVEEALKMKEVTDRKFAEQKALRDEKKSKLDRLQKQLGNFKEKELAENKKLEGMEQELEKLKETISRKEKEGRASLSGNNKIAGMEKKLHELGREEGELQEVEGANRTAFERAREEFQTAQDATDGNNQMDVVDRALLEAKADGTLPGLFGRLKNLAKIQEKYNIAASVSSGMLEYWICDNETTAGHCIAFLRDNHLAYQNFMCLNRLTSYIRSAQERFDTPAGSHRIFDLLEISDRNLVPAYFKAFRNTLVADNIDIATKVSHGGSKRHRVATLLGEIVEITGSMVGGGRQKMPAKFNSKKSGLTVSKQQLANLKKRHDECLNQYKKAQEAREVLTAAARNLSEEIEDAKRKLNNFTSDMAALKAQLPLKEANVQTQRRKLKEVSLSPSVLQGKEAEIEDAQNEYEETEEPFEEAKVNSDRINQKVDDLQVTKKKEITKKLDKFNDQLKKVVEELNRKIVELKNCETNRKKTEKKLASVQQEIENMQKTMEKKNERRKKLEGEAKEIKEAERELSAKLEETKKAFDDLSASSHENLKEENSLTKEKLSLENKLGDATGEVKGLANFLKNMEVERKGLKLYDIPEEEVEELKTYTDDEIKVYSVPELEKKVKKHADAIKSKPIPNLNILEEYREKIETLLERINELEAITTQRDQFREAYCLLDQQRSTEFMEGFALISSRLKEMFRMISMGGDAELEVVDTLDLFGCGINFSVRPARKTWKKISNLSGGEKTLASLSLVFALHHFKPSPFYVMDEIDAALDFKNVSIIANYIKDRTKFTQFIIISLRSNMFELADSLLGVYKVDNMSYCIHFGVRMIVDELKRKIDKGKNPAAIHNPDNPNHNGASQPVKASQQQVLQPIRPNTAVPSTSKEALKQLQEQNKLQKQNFPGVEDVSAIIDLDEQPDSPNDPSIEDNTMIEADKDNSFTPPGRVSDTPSAAANNSADNGTHNPGSQDMFEGDDSESPFPTKGAKARVSLPKFTSTPFVAKRNTQVPGAERANGENGGGFISDDDEDDDEVMEVSPPISPIKGSGTVRVIPESPNGASDDSFRSAKEVVDDSDVDEIGPTQE